MNKIGLVLRELHHDEQRLARELALMSERHVADHEIHHVGHDLASWSLGHLRHIAEAGEEHGVHLDPDPGLETGVGARLREKGGDVVRHWSAPGLLLLRDLREVHLRAVGVSLAWEMLAQAAQGSKDSGLLGLARRCHPDTLRQMRWANAHIKQNSAQILTS